MNFLTYGDSPQRGFPLRAWPQYSRVGGQITGEPPFYPPRPGGGGIVKAGFRRPQEKRDLAGIQDDKDITEILMIGLESGIIH